MTLALDFPLGRPFTPAALVRRQRPLPPGATVLVAANDTIRADQAIAEYRVTNGQVVKILAGLTGRIYEVAPERHVAIESVATIDHGVIGLGGAAAGPLAVLPRGESPAVAPVPRGAVILFPHQAPLMLLQRAAGAGAAGVIAASASARELEAIARADLSAALDGTAPEAPRAPITVVLTEGLGSASMSTAIYQFLSTRLHSVVLLHGATNPGRGVRPEILMTTPSGAVPAQMPAESALVPGAQVAVAAGGRRGARGTIMRAFASPQVTEGGIRAPSVLVRFDDGAVATVPVHALDRIG